MAIQLIKDHRQSLILSIKQYFREELDQDIADLKASLLLDFILKEFGPVIYNGTIADAQARMQEMVAELDGACYQPEFTYWKR